MQKGRMLMRNIGVAGCGRMGSGLVKNLIKKGYYVSVYDINEMAVQKLADIGAKVKKDIRAMASEVDVLILSLTSTVLIEKLMLNSEVGAFGALKKGAVVLDMSTNDVDLTRKLSKIAKQHDLEYFDCPLSGGPSGADEGTLTIMVGGCKEKFPYILPVLEAVGEKIDYVGESGAGQIVKLCNNMIVGGIITLLSEAFLTGERAGVSKQKIASILQKGSGQTKVMEVFGPNLLKNSPEEVKFSLFNMTKDLNLYRSLAESAGVPTVASESARQLFQIAEYLKKGQQDSTAVFEIISKLGVEGKSNL